MSIDIDNYARALNFPTQGVAFHRSAQYFKRVIIYRPVKRVVPS